MCVQRRIVECVAYETQAARMCKVNDRIEFLVVHSHLPAKLVS